MARLDGRAERGRIMVSSRRGSYRSQKKSWREVKEDDDEPDETLRFPDSDGIGDGRERARERG